MVWTKDGRKKQVAEFEAGLYIRPEKGFLRIPRGKGELEYKKYDDGSATFEIKFQHLDVPVMEAAVSLFVNDTEVAQIPVKKGCARLVLRTYDGDSVPEIDKDDKVRVMYGDLLLCVGTFLKDR